MVVLRSSLLSLVALGVTLAPAQAQSISGQVLGCFSSVGSLTNQGIYTFQSQGYCVQTCSKLGKNIAAITKGTECYCGDEAPAASDKVDDSKCEAPCTGYPSQSCGGSDTWTVLKSEHQSGGPAIVMATNAGASIPSGTATATTLAGGIIVDGGSSPSSTPASSSAFATSMAASKAVSSSVTAASSTSTTDSNAASSVEYTTGSVLAAGLLVLMLV